MSGRDTALKAAAFDAAGLALEVRCARGDLALANAAATGLEPLPQEARGERLVNGRAMLIEQAGFRFQGEDFRVVAAIDIDAQRRLQDDLFARAYFDATTGLPNRELCARTVADLIAARGDRAPFAVAVLEIDRFSEIVALHGAPAAEALAARIGERLSQEIGAGDLIARLAADAFAVVKAAPGGAEALAASCRRWVERATEPYLIDGVEIFVSAGLGASLWPADDATPEGLRRKAEAAAREARRAGGGARLFAAEFDARERERARQENALRQAIRDRRIGCAFQPKYDFRAERVDSLEVLMRWRGEDGAWSTPGNFLRVAHEAGLINEITEQVFEETMLSLDAVNAAFGAQVRLGFNIAARQACDTRFMRGFLDRLAATGHARRFMLEITEEAFVPASQFQARVLPMIREVGAHLSIDDFGAGYSSLATLADITADEVKVDRSLIVDIDKRPRSQSLLKAIESIGAALLLEVIVEGVETAQEYAYLRDHTRIRVAQGYYFGKPLMLGQVEGGVEWRERCRAPARLGRARATPRG